MGVKAEYNPSTGLMHFTAATKKVQVVGETPGVPCSECSDPSVIYVTISGIESCCAVAIDTGIQQSFHIPESLLSAINTTHTLTRFTACRYLVFYSQNYDITRYDDRVCSSENPPALTINGFSVTVNLATIPGIMICSVDFRYASTDYGLQEWVNSATLPCWEVTYNNPSVANCGDTTDFDPPTLLDDYSTLVAGGTFAISETP